MGHGLMSGAVERRWRRRPELRLRRNYDLWDDGTMAIVPSLRSSSLLWSFATQGGGFSTIIDGRLCLLYFGGLSLGLRRFSPSASVVCLEEMQQRPDRNPIASSVT